MSALSGKMTPKPEPMFDPEFTPPPMAANADIASFHKRSADKWHAVRRRAENILAPSLVMFVLSCGSMFFIEARHFTTAATIFAALMAVCLISGAVTVHAERKAEAADRMRREIFTKQRS